MRYRSEIDGLRAFAVIPVIFFHAGFAAFSGGFVGVDIFFVISGYLITTIILMESRDFSFVRFYERRARRIVPALFVVVLACIVPAWLLLPPLEMKQFSHSVVAVVLFSSNILFWRESGYFEPSAELKPLLHTWSLAVEEQFYFLFPIFLLTVLRFSRRWFVAWFAVVGIASFALAQWGSIHDPTAAFYAIPTRAWELVVGALLADHLLRRSRSTATMPQSGGAVAEVAGAVGLLLIVASIVGYDRLTPFPGIYAVVPVLGASLVILFAGADNHVGRLLGWKPLVGIGLISYSAYLWHQPLFAFARHRSLDEPSAHAFLLLCAATGVLAFLSWRFVERPFRSKSQVTRRAIFALTLAGSLVFIAFGLAGRFTEGFRSARLTDAQVRLLATIQNSPEAKKCHASDSNDLAPQDACTFFAPDVQWAVLGDSHGVTLSHALAKELEPSGIGLKQLTFSGCFPTYQRTDLQTPCARWTQRAVRELIDHPHITTVVVAYKLDSISFGGDAEPYPALPPVEPNAERDRRLASYDATIADLRRAGKRVIVMDQAPCMRAGASDLIYQFGRSGGDIVGVRRALWDERNRFMKVRMRDLPAGVREVDPAAVLCQGDVCMAVADGESRYFDDNHMSIFGARLVAREILAANPARIP